MFTFANHTMTNHHVNHECPGLLARIVNTVHIWRDRSITRRELAQWSLRDMHDAGVSWSDVNYEVNKPFWRA